MVIDLLASQSLCHVRSQRMPLGELQEDFRSHCRETLVFRQKSYHPSNTLMISLQRNAFLSLIPSSNGILRPKITLEIIRDVLAP